MMKKHGRLWSYALAGALAVSNLSAIMSPLTAQAATIGNAKVGDIISYAVGTAGTSLKDPYKVPNVISNPEAALPAQDAAIASTGIVAPPAGYHFVWTDGVNNLDPREDKQAAITVGEDRKATLTGAFDGNAIPIILNLDEGTGVTAPKKNYETDLATAIKDPTKTGFTFKGWDLDGNDAKVEIVAGATAAVQSKAIDAKYKADNYGSTDGYKLTMTAVYDENTYTVKFNGNGMTSGTLPADTSAKYTQITNSTKIPALTSILKKTGYADLKPSATEEPAKLWNTKADGKGKDVVDEATFASIFGADYKDKEITLYANFVEDTWAVTLNLAGGTLVNVGTPWDKNSVTAKVNQSEGTITLPSMSDNASLNKNEITIESPSGYGNFLGWDTEAKSDTHKPTVVYTAGQKVNISKNTILYAVYEQKIAQTTVAFNRNTLGTGKMSSVTVDQGEYTLPENGFVAKSGYHFIGWAKELNEATGLEGGVKTWANENAANSIPGKKITLSGTSIILYAVYAPDEAETFTLNLYEGTTLKSSTKYTQDASAELPESIASGKVFLGWDTTSTSTNPKYSAGTKVSKLFNAGATVNLYAIYAAQGKTVSITYYKDNDDAVISGLTPVKAAQNSNVAISSATSLGDKEIIGWTKIYYPSIDAAIKAKATIYDPGATIAVGTSDIKLYVLTQTAAHELTFNSNAPVSYKVTGTMEPIKSYDTFVAPECAFEIVGCSFDGWMTEAGKKYAVGDVVPADVKTLKAQWKVDEYRIVYDKNSDLIKGSKTSAIISTDVKAYESVDYNTTGLTSPTGTSLLGWSLSADAETPEFYDDIDSTYGDVIEAANASAGDTIKLYAVWQFPEDIQEAKEAQKEAEKEAAAQKEAADAAKADAQTQKDAKEAAEKELATAKEELSKVSKAQNNAEAATGEMVDTKVDGTAVIKSVPAAAVKNGSYTVPEKIIVNGAEYSVTKIEAKALKNNKQIKQITVPSTVTEIGTQAFQGAKNLKKVTIKGKDVVIRKNAFKKINKKAKIFVADKDTKTNVTAKGGAPKTVKVKVKK